MDKVSQYEHILSALKQNRYVSGTELASALSVSRTVVNRRLQELEAMDLRIHAVTGKGYHLDSQVSLLDDRLSDLGDDFLFRRHLITRSTNEDVLAMAGIQPGNIVVATEYQTEGRGRRGRGWHSSFGQDLAFSVGFVAPSADTLRPYSLCVGILLARALRRLFALDVRLKWPNDLWVGGAKLSGILTELHTLNGQLYVIVGTGMNVNRTDFEGIDQAATSLRREKGQVIDRSELLNGLSGEIAEAVRDDFSLDWYTLWPEYDALLNLPVSVQQNGVEYIGQGKGITRDGAFLLETSEGEHRFNGGEVRVRPR